MINTNDLKRGNQVLYGDDIVVVLTIAKTSLRVYNITKDNYIEKWLSDKEFEPLPLSKDVMLGLGFDHYKEEIKHIKLTYLSLEELKDKEWLINMGFFKLITVKYQHELDNLLSVLGYNSNVGREEN